VTRFEGRLWIIQADGKLVDDIDTDQIFHNRHLAITDIVEMGQHAFGNLEGWQHFAKQAKRGDMVLVGANFGSGSSRQQAVDCFVSLGVTCVIAKSYGAIYKRNAINSGFPILILKELNFNDQAGAGYVAHLDDVAIDLENATIEKDGQPVGSVEPFSKVQMDIYKAGNIFKYAKELE